MWTPAMGGEMTPWRLSVSATMLLGIDRFVAVVEDGIEVPHSTRHVQPWLGGEILLGGALWSLWTDGTAELVSRPSGPDAAASAPLTDVRLCGRARYPNASLETRLVVALSDRPEPVIDVLTRALGFTGAQPWCDLILAAYGELVAAGYPIGPTTGLNGRTPRFLAQATSEGGHLDRTPTTPADLVSAVEQLSARWDSWWSGNEAMLVALARACHDSLAIRRQRFAREVVHGLPLRGEPPDHAEAAARQARSRCPRWPRHL
jgi:hypothetical protein